jgi:hypothetical protein
MAYYIQDSLVVTDHIYGSVTGSLLGTASLASTASYVNPLRQTVTITGSLNVTGSTTQVGNNNLFGNTTLSGSIIISGSTTTPSVQIYGNTTHNGYIRFDPVTTNIDQTVSASYIYVSGSTQDLYFTQNGGGYNNTTRLRWLEGNLYTGLLHGGLISASVGGTTFNVSSGSGIIVTINASITQDPYPTIKFVNWGNFTDQAINELTTAIQTYVGIDSNGAIIQQTTPWNDGQYNESISLGTVIHQNLSTVNATITYPNVAYGYKQRTYDFIKAFGPLKLSGYRLNTSSSLGLTVNSGSAFADGRNYQNDPNNPSYINDNGTAVSKIFRYYQSGSSFVQDTNAGAGYTGIDSTLYNPDGSGSLASVSPSKFYVQRIFWYPNSATKGIVSYYGLAEYSTIDEAQAGYTNEPFIETPNTQQNAIFLGVIIIKGNSNFNSTNNYRVVQSSLFRAAGTGGGGGGGAGASSLSSLTDVQLGTITDKQSLVYDIGSSKWINSYTLSGSLEGTASFALTASFAPDYVLTSTTSSMLAPYVLTSSTSSMLSPYLLTSRTSSFATTGSNTFIGNQTITGSLTISSSADPQFVIGNNLLRISSSGQLGISGSIIPNVHNTYTLGTSTVRFATLFVQGTVNGNTGLFNNINMGSSTPMSFINNQSNTVAQWYGLTANLRMQSGSTPAYVDNGYRLQINSLGAVSGGLYITGSANQQLIRVDTAGTNGIFFVSSSGNVGIGTVTPRFKLEISTGSLYINPPTGGTVAGIYVSGSNTRGGAQYLDFLQVTNTTGSATNPNKFFRIDNTGNLQIINSSYGQNIFQLSDIGNLYVNGATAAGTSNTDGVSGSLMFNNNNSQIYDDGNMHIHSRTSGQAMWINTNAGQLNLLVQSPLLGGNSGSGVAIGTGTLTGFVTINSSKDYTTSAAYGYLTTAGAGTYPGGSQTVNLSLYAVGRIWGQEIDAFSDERMKDIKGDISLSDGIKLVKNLKPIEYTWKDDPNKGLKAGYSAQQVSKAGFDHLISLVPKEGLEETIDEDGFVSPKDTQFSMNYDQVVPYHGTVIKYLLEKIEQLEKEIQLLKEE